MSVSLTQWESYVITDEVRDFIKACLEEDRPHEAKQKHTAKRIYDRLVVFEKGFTGGESTVRNAVKALRIEVMVPPQADMPLEYEPGDAVQIDWGEATVYIDGEKCKVQFLRTPLLQLRHFRTCISFPKHGIIFRSSAAAGSSLQRNSQTSNL